MYTGPNIITNGLVLSLDAANIKSYPGSGTVWRDLSGNNNSGTLTNGPTFSSANGGSIVFNGTNNYINLGNTNSLKPSTITLSAWIKTSVTASYKSVIEKDKSPWISTALHLSNGVPTFFIGYTNSPPYSVSIGYNQNVSDGNWHQIVGTYDNSNLRLYIDGIEVASSGSNVSILYSNANFMIGFHSENFSYFNGLIPNAMVYNRALTASEVLQNYNATKGRFGL
jgi:hypothetical protein